MRLIDADRLKIKITGITKPHEFVEEIDKRPTVQAIPIEWLRKERDKNKEIAEKFSKEDLDIDFISK